MNENIQRLDVNAFTIPTETPESDGTAEWSATTMILVQLGAQGMKGIGYSYGHECCVPLIRHTLFPILQGKNPFSLAAFWKAMQAAVRNVGRIGIASTAIAAVDNALWDLKARILHLPLVRLLGALREKIPVYGSGGFTSYSEEQLCHQMETWASEGISMVKMKIGREPATDLARIAAARWAIGNHTELFVDANGAYSPRQALEQARIFSDQNVSWFEEPVSSDNLDGLRFVREHATMDVAAGEYNYNVWQARAMLEAGSVDVLQADATRCGITGFLQMAELCDAFEAPLSAHTSPALHATLCCAATRARHVEYFFDHYRIEQMLFDGRVTRHEKGFLRPDESRPGLGLEFKRKDAEQFRVDI